DQLLPEVELAPLLRIASLVALGKERVGVGQIPEPFRGVVLDGQIGQRTARHEGQGDGDLRDALFIEGVLDKLTNEPSLTMLFGLSAQARPVHVKPLRHGYSSLNLPSLQHRRTARTGSRFGSGMNNDFTRPSSVRMRTCKPPSTLATSPVSPTSHPM